MGRRAGKAASMASIVSTLMVVFVSLLILPLQTQADYYSSPTPVPSPPKEHHQPPYSKPPPLPSPSPPKEHHHQPPYSYKPPPPPSPPKEHHQPPSYKPPSPPKEHHQPPSYIPSSPPKEHHPRSTTNLLPSHKPPFSPLQALPKYKNIKITLPHPFPRPIPNPFRRPLPPFPRVPRSGRPKPKFSPPPPPHH